jgi:hypothetical protein
LAAIVAAALGLAAMIIFPSSETAVAPPPSDRSASETKPVVIEPPSPEPSDPGAKTELPIAEPNDGDTRVGPAPKEARPAQAPLRSDSVPRRTTVRPPAKQKPSSPPETQPAPLPPPPAGDGWLSVKTSPWTTVFLGNESLGSTPIFKVRLQPGKHQLRLVNAGEGIDVKRDVVIEPGKTLKLDVDLESVRTTSEGD